MGVKQGFNSQNLTRCAKSALKGIRLDKGLLNGVQPTVF
jgi:hypothetical protein